jgi:hypothetical protein
VVNVPLLWFAKAPKSQKAARSAKGRARVPHADTGSALKARTKKRLTRRLGAPPPLGKRKKERKGGPAPSSTGMRSVGSEHVPQKWEPVLRPGHAQANAPGLFDIVKKVRTTARDRRCRVLQLAFRLRGRGRIAPGRRIGAIAPAARAIEGVDADLVEPRHLAHPRRMHPVGMIVRRLADVGQP